MANQLLTYSLAVYGAPFSSQSCQTALAFAQALVGAGHRLERVFFYQDGIHTGNGLAVPPQDEPNFSDQWRSLARKHDVEMVVCVAAALRRGVLDATEAARYEKTGDNLAPGFIIGGLGQLLDAAVQSDRLVTFGA